MEKIKTAINKNSLLILQTKMMLPPSVVSTMQREIARQMTEGVIVIPNGFSYELVSQKTDSPNVVRCKDCWKNGTTECGMSWTNIYKCVVDQKPSTTWNKDNDFCSWGERKGEK